MQSVNNFPEKCSLESGNSSDKELQCLISAARVTAEPAGVSFINAVQERGVVLNEMQESCLKLAPGQDLDRI